MPKSYYLKKFRNCPSVDILDIMISYMRKSIPDKELTSLEGAYDHRRAELIMNKLYSEIPSDVWRNIS